MTNSTKTDEVITDKCGSGKKSKKPRKARNEQEYSEMLMDYLLEEFKSEQ